MSAKGNTRFRAVFTFANPEGADASREIEFELPYRIPDLLLSQVSAANVETWKEYYRASTIQDEEEIRLTQQVCEAINRYEEQMRVN